MLWLLLLLHAAAVAQSDDAADDGTDDGTCAAVAERCSQTAPQRAASGSATPLTAVLEFIAKDGGIEGNANFLQVWATQNQVGNFLACNDNKLMGQQSHWCDLITLGPQLGVCVAKDCSARDLEQHEKCQIGDSPKTLAQLKQLQDFLSSKNRTKGASALDQLMELEVAFAGRMFSTGQSYCVDDEHMRPKAGATGVLGVLAALAFIVLCATAVDFTSDLRLWPKRKRPHEIADEVKSRPVQRSQFVKTWSSIYCVERLFTVDERAATLRVLDGVRALSTGYIVLGHTAIFSMSTAAGAGFIADEVPFLTRYFTSLDGLLLSGAFLAVDTFFWLSGFLATLMLLKATHSGKRLLQTATLAVLGRWLRLAPLVGLVLGFETYVKALFLIGPWSGTAAQHLKDPCAESWWRVLFFVSNLRKHANDGMLCVGWTWYLSNDMQFFVCTALPAALIVAALSGAAPHAPTTAQPFSQASFSAQPFRRQAALAAAAVFCLVQVGISAGVTYSKSEKYHLTAGFPSNVAVYAFLSHAAFQILAKVSFAVYMWHLVFIPVISQTQLDSVAFSRFRLLERYAAVLLCAVAAAVSSYVLCEKPAASLVQIALGKLKGTRQPAAPQPLEQPLLRQQQLA
ncbi:hypothetical protein M885DRAFT_585574 [Pelagophyceae sp. CCMP2097]|nr:hypothetical protein M885DRAFT_585574 [Pelagophyceae sp. CCMP2097]